MAWKGSTKAGLEQNAMLGAKWWAVGDRVLCIFQRKFMTKFGEGYSFLLVKPIEVNVDEFGVATKNGNGAKKILTSFALPPLKGFEIALQNLQMAGFPGFEWGDKCILECTEMKKPDEGEEDRADMPCFEISVDSR